MFYISPYNDGHLNLAIDEYLLNTIGPDEFILYLYVNSNAVIIGRNQNGERVQHGKDESDGYSL